MNVNGRGISHILSLSIKCHSKIIWVRTPQIKWNATLQRIAMLWSYIIKKKLPSHLANHPSYNPMWERERDTQSLRKSVSQSAIYLLISFEFVIYYNKQTMFFCGFIYKIIDRQTDNRVKLRKKESKKTEISRRKRAQTKKMKKTANIQSLQCASNL